MNNKKRNKNKFKTMTLICLIVVISFTILCVMFVDNKNVDYQNFQINFSEKSNTNVKIIHLSDLHFPKIAVDLISLLKNIQEQAPNIIAITGDLIDGSANVEECGVFNFIEKLVDIAPVYYVNGNHEIRASNANVLYEYLSSKGVVILNNESKNITINNNNITIIGVMDNSVYSNKCYENNEEIENNYTILLVHRPMLNVTATNTISPNLILSGHIHGGQVRIFGKGLISPDTLFFPKYHSGLYKENNTNLIVSRGLGSSLLPIRFNNKPHVPIIDIAF